MDEFFTPEELAKMSPIEKRRYKNLRANYEVMKAMGESNRNSTIQKFLSFVRPPLIKSWIGTHINIKFDI